MAGLTQQAFDDRVAGYADSACHRSGPSLPLVLEFANVSPEYFVLDVGTGTGFTAHALVERGAYVDALDVSQPMLRHTRAAAPAPLRAVRAAAGSIPARGGSYDVVTCRHALHHFADPADAIGEMARVLRPGGRVVIADTQSPGRCVGGCRNARHRDDPRPLARAQSVRRGVPTLPPRRRAGRGRGP